MKNSKYLSLCLGFLFVLSGSIWVKASAASIVEQGSEGSKTWILENEVVSFEVGYTTGEGIRLKQFYNKEAALNYIGDNSSLFDYTGQFLPLDNTSPVIFRYQASDRDWLCTESRIEDVRMSSSLSHIVLGKKLSITLEREGIAVRLEFELFDGRSGLRYQTHIRNKRSDAKLLIEKADVIRLDMPARPHNTHYVVNSAWLSTTGSIEEASLKNNANDVPKCLINLYDSMDGWYVAPEVNWKTQYGPEEHGKQDHNQPYYYQLRPFALTTAWAQESQEYVKVQTCPEAFQLVLFPQEEFEYIAVNITAFKGDIVDGKMAVEEHFRKRFRFHDTTTSLMVNDWDWFRDGLRTEEYFYNVVFPKAKAAGYDIVLIDDGWNNSTSDGKWITDDDYSRDPIISNAPGIPDMKAMADAVKTFGFKLGLWYSNSGGGHNKGRDLADPVVQENKKAMLESMIADYDLKHQAVDLTQYWQNLDETTYSHPSDNVYRKNVLTRRMMNEVVDAHPDYEIKVTSELDLYPNPGDRMTELIHLPNNGWMTITGNDKPIDAMGIHFGHLPLNAIYLGSGGDPTDKADELYAVLSGRDVKAHKLPTNWSDEGIELFGMMNKWRKGIRVKALTDQLVRPVFLGKGWDAADASDWEKEVAPYIWMYTNEDKSSAFVIATGGGRSILVPPADYPLRWVDAGKTYLVQDVTLDDTRVFTYAFKGLVSGETLKNTGLNINLYENSSPAKAYWIQEYTGAEKQVIFADDEVKTYTEILNGNQLIVEATGNPGATGIITVYGATEKDAQTFRVTFNNEGLAELKVTSIVNNDVPYPGESGEPLKLEFEDFHTTLEKSNPDIKVNRFDNGFGAESGYSSVMIMTAVGDYVVYNMSIPFAGKYQVKLNYKVSKTNRGEAQFYYIDEGGNESPLGNVIDQSTTGNEEMRTVDCGSITLTKAGAVRIKMKLVGGGNSGNGKYIGANYILFTKE